MALGENDLHNSLTSGTSIMPPGNRLQSDTSHFTAQCVAGSMEVKKLFNAPMVKDDDPRHAGQDPKDVQPTRHHETSLAPMPKWVSHDGAGRSVHDVMEGSDVQPINGFHSISPTDTTETGNDTSAVDVAPVMTSDDSPTSGRPRIVIKQEQQDGMSDRGGFDNAIQETAPSHQNQPCVDGAEELPTTDTSGSVRNRRHSDSDIPVLSPKDSVLSPQRSKSAVAYITHHPNLVPYTEPKHFQEEWSRTRTQVMSSADHQEADAGCQTKATYLVKDCPSPVQNGLDTSDGYLLTKMKGEALTPFGDEHELKPCPPQTGAHDGCPPPLLFQGSDPRGQVMPNEVKHQCVVCGEFANGNFFGAVVCLPCKSFFIRCTKDGEPTISQRCYGDCEIRNQLRNRCQFCRYKRCLAVGMSRKEKPESIQPADGQELCKVCGDLANGIHFGVNTCEGCKKFFRRGLKEHTSYVCKDNNNCCLNPRNRNNCRYCRFQKCLNVGMSREAIKMGRPRKLYSGSRHLERQHQSNAISPKRNSQDSNDGTSPTHYFQESDSHVDCKKQRIDNYYVNNQFIHSVAHSRQQAAGDVTEQPDRLVYLSQTDMPFLDERHPNIRGMVKLEHVQNVSHLPNPAIQQQPNARTCNFGQVPGQAAYEPRRSLSPTPDIKGTFTNPVPMISSDQLRFCPPSNGHFEIPPKVDCPAPVSPFHAAVTFPYRERCPSSDTLQSHTTTNSTLEASSSRNSANDIAVQYDRCPSSEELYASTYKVDNHVSPAFNNSLRNSHLPSHHPLNEMNDCCVPILERSRTCVLVERGVSYSEEDPEVLDLSVGHNKTSDGTEDENVNSESKLSDQRPSDSRWLSSSVEQTPPAVKRKYCDKYLYVDSKVVEGETGVLTFPYARSVQEDARTDQCHDPYSVKYSETAHPVQGATLVECHSVYRHGQMSASSEGGGKGVHSSGDREFGVLSEDASQYKQNLGSVNSSDSVELYLVSKRPRLDQQCSPVNLMSLTGSKHNGRTPSSPTYQHSQEARASRTNVLQHNAFSRSSFHDTSCPGEPCPNMASPGVPVGGSRSGSNVEPFAPQRFSRCGPWNNGQRQRPLSEERHDSSFDPYCNESTFKYINEMFMVCDSLLDTSDRVGGQSELAVVEGMLTNAYGYSPSKIAHAWKEVSRLRPLDTASDQVRPHFSQEDCGLIGDLVWNLEEKVLFCDEDANRPAINTNGSEWWPARGQDKEYWQHFHQRIARQTYAETQFAHRVADKLRVTDRKKLEESSKFLGNTILMASREWFDPVRKKFKFFWNWKLPQEHPLYPFHQRITRVGSHIFNLHMDRTEITLLSILNILTPANSKMEDSPQMAEKIKRILQLFSLYLHSISVDPDDRIPELLSLMPQVHHMSVWYSNLIKNMKADPRTMDRTLNDLIQLASHAIAKVTPVDKSVTSCV